MILEILLFVVVFGGGGFAFGYFVFGKRKYRKSCQKKEEVINNPHLLKEKLEANGDFVDMGEKISMDVVKKDGVEVLDFKRTAVPQKPAPKIPNSKKKKKGTKKKSKAKN